MSEGDHILGICFSGNALYYALRHVQSGSALRYIGKADFSFSVEEAFAAADEALCSNINTTIQRLAETWSVNTVRIVSFPRFECWTSLPKLAYDNSSEREAHLSLLARGRQRNLLETTWFETSNRDFRFLSIREHTMVEMLNACTRSISNTEYCADFEVGLEWMRHSGSKGSFLSVGCSDNTVTVSSFLLGKLRAATRLNYRHPDDLAYSWRQNEAHLSWMKGYHEDILMYGSNCSNILNRLQPMWDESAVVRRINSLDDMQVTADEHTYSFPLEQAFPAVMMALKSD